MFRWLLAFWWTVGTPALAGVWTRLPAAAPGPALPGPVAGWEENRGQARAGTLFVSRGFAQSLEVDGLGVRFAPHGMRIGFKGASAVTAVAWSEPLAGGVNVYSGAATNWVRWIPRFAHARLRDVYPGVDAVFINRPDVGSRLRWELAAGVDPAVIQLELTGGTRVVSGPVLSVRLRTSPPAYGCSFGAFTVSQGGVNLSGRYTPELAFEVEGRDPRRPLAIELALACPIPNRLTFPVAGSLTNARGDRFIARPVSDPGYGPCGFTSVNAPLACSDVSVESYSRQGELLWVSYLRGTGHELPTALQWVAGELLVSGATDSPGFPTNSDAPQPRYAGPPRLGFIDSTAVGDLFLSRLHPQDGALLRSTYWGGPEGDRPGMFEPGGAGDVFVWARNAPGMPVTAGSPACRPLPCGRTHVTRLDDGLTRVIYATYLPGEISELSAGRDGSVSFGGRAGPGFPVTPHAYQREFGGGRNDSVIGRLSPSGEILFATYFGGEEDEGTIGIAVAGDGTVWADSGGTWMLHFDATLGRLLARYAVAAGPTALGARGLRGLTRSLVTAPGALQTESCGRSYVILPPEGTEVQVYPLPEEAKFAWEDWASLPVELDAEGSIVTTRGRFQLDADREGPPVARCLVSAADLSVANVASPGAIVTVFGSGFGDSPDGTRLLMGGVSAPLIAVAPGQLTAVVPAGLSGEVNVRVERAGVVSEPFRVDLEAWRLSLFVQTGSPRREALALNEDGSWNSALRPARRGSRLVFFGTGAGETILRTPPGSSHPLQLVPFLVPVTFFFAGRPVRPDYAGGVPGAIAGLGQFNVTLPGDLPSGPVLVEAEAGGGVRTVSRIFVF